MSLRKTLITWAALAGAGGCFVGCATMPTVKMETPAFLKPTPNRMVVGLTPSMLERDGLPYHQGIYCRVHFFLNEEPMPLPVKGDLQMTAYDRGKNGDEPTPVGVYVIPKEELAKHWRKDMIGDSYIVWLPYNPEKPTEMMITGSFKPVRGEPITASPSKLHLTPLRRVAAGDRLDSAPKPYRQYTVIDTKRRAAERSQVATMRLPTSPNATLNQPNALASHEIVDGLVVPASAMIPSQAVPRLNQSPATAGLPAPMPTLNEATLLPPGDYIPLP